MEQKKDKTENIIFSTDVSTEALFDKIKSWETPSQVKFSASLNNPKRKELFEKIIEAETSQNTKRNISLIIERIEQAAIRIPGYTPTEIEYYQSLFAIEFYTVLHSENYQQYIEDKIRDLMFYCNALEQEIKTQQYEFVEDKEQCNSQLTEAERFKFYLESLLYQITNPTPLQTETKTDKLKAELSKHGFFELPKVKQLSEPNKQNLIELITTNSFPYSIAMFEHLQFLKHLIDKHFTTNEKLCKEVANWFNVTKRTVKGNINVLNEYSKENRKRYTADQQKQIAETDYQKLK